MAFSWRQVRMFWEQEAVVSTFPTPKGVRELTWMHKMFDVRRIIQKPCKHFKDSLFIKVLQAQKEGTMIPTATTITTTITPTHHKAPVPNVPCPLPPSP